MNLQSHLSGQLPGPVPNQAGATLPGPSSQAGNAAPTQIQNPNMYSSVPNMDPEYADARAFMREKIWECIMLGNQQSREWPEKKVFDLVKRLEEALCKSARTREEYLNQATLKSRLQALFKRSMNNQNQQFAQPSSSPSMGTMIPTPGLQQTATPTANVSHSLDNSHVLGNSANSMAFSTNNYGNGNFMPSGNGPSTNVHASSFSSSDGAFPPSSAAFAVNSGRSNMGTSMGMHKMASQMIPTPGFNNSDNSNLNSNHNSQVIMESRNIASSFPAVESLPPPMQPKQLSQNSRILQNIGGGFRSTLQQKPYGLSSGPLNGGLGMLGSSVPMMTGAGVTETHMSGSVYGNSTQSFHQHFDQHQHTEMHGDGIGIDVANVSASGNFYPPVSLVGSVVNNQSLNSMSIQPLQKSSSSLSISNPSSVQQLTSLKPQSMDQSQFHVSENPVAPHQLQQLPHSSHHLQSQQLVQQQAQQRLLTQSQSMIKSGTISQSQLSSSLVSHPKLGHVMENSNEALHPRLSHQMQLPDVQSQVHNKSTEDRSRSNQLLSHLNAGQTASSSLSQTSDLMAQILNPQQPILRNDFDTVSGGIKWSQDVSDAQGGFHHEQSLESGFHKSLGGQDAAQPNNLSSEESKIFQPESSQLVVPPSSTVHLTGSKKINQEQQYRNQQRWLLFLRHARRCPAPEGRCQELNCITVQKLLKHIEHCNTFQCIYPRCCMTRLLINHHRRCCDLSCPVCIPVKNFVQKTHLKALGRTDMVSGFPSSANGSQASCEANDSIGRPSSKNTVIVETHEDLQPSIKRLKIEPSHQFISAEGNSSVRLAPAEDVVPIQDAQHRGTLISVKPENTEIKSEVRGILVHPISKMVEMKNAENEDAYIQKSEGDSTLSTIPSVLGMVEVSKSAKELEHSKIPLPAENTSKSGKPKIKGVSLTELFTPEQVRQHITGLRLWVGQSKVKAEKNQAMEHSMSENSCQLCAVEKLTFEPPPIYCTPCGARIKRNAMYYTFGAGETRHYLCIPCYNETRGDSILVDGTSIPKARLEKKKNDEETEEWWVQCDKCEAWQHQICALFNGRRNDGGQAEYTCPNCYIKEVERGERMPLPQSTVLGAKDLPRTILSDHIEQRLFSKLKQERLDRARLLGKSYDEIPGAESLVIRVVSSVDKKLEVKPRFLEIFQGENYPVEFPYKSKVILLFQKIEGVEVCLFGMYVQEFGSECPQPNHRRVYLSYLDSVKYFRPEVKAVTGEALRTFVYHEILIGYLEYCKLRGFTSCYIWACPPLKGEDYILYCHPEIQKTPKSDKLREWYLSMLRKAGKESIVVDLANLYDHFFVCLGECKAKVTACRLPYFDGDYWPGAAEDMIYQLQQEDDGKKLHKKGTIKKTITKRALKASGQTDLSGNASKDLLLMHKLGDTISPMKEDFIMVHLQYPCSHCCILMVSGNRWACKQCKNFQLCDKCYDVERKREDRERHPTNLKEKHTLYPIEITGVPEDTKDRDEILESEFFDTRQAFLSLCQGNHYQYDTLRRAKHSSMMVLYHLHNPTAPAFVTTCNVCHLDIESGQGWRCETCPDYDVCNACYKKDGGIDHPHKLTNHPSNDRDAQNQEARQMRVMQLRKMLDLLVHAAQCRSPACQYPNCRKVKGLFRHGYMCKVRASGGCPLCKKMWNLLQLHARACKESECTVPRCRDLKVHMRRLQQQSDSRRRAAVMEMMRQRAAEVASSS